MVFFFLGHVEGGVMGYVVEFQVQNPRGCFQVSGGMEGMCWKPEALWLHKLVRVMPPRLKTIIVKSLASVDCL